MTRPASARRTRPRRGSRRRAARARGRRAEREAEHEVGGREPAGDRDSSARSSAGVERLARDDDGPYAVAHRGAVRQQPVAVGDVRVGAHRERRDLEPPLARPVVQRLDVRDDVLELEPARVDAARRDRPEHERVVGIRAVSDTDPHGADLNAGRLSFFRRTPLLIACHRGAVARLSRGQARLAGDWLRSALCSYSLEWPRGQLLVSQSVRIPLHARAEGRAGGRVRDPRASPRPAARPRFSKTRTSSTGARPRRSVAPRPARARARGRRRHHRRAAITHPAAHRLAADAPLSGELDDAGADREIPRGDPVRLEERRRRRRPRGPGPRRRRPRGARAPRASRGRRSRPARSGRPTRASTARASRSRRTQRVRARVVELPPRRVVRADRADERAVEQPLAAQHRVLRGRHRDHHVLLGRVPVGLGRLAAVLAAERRAAASRSGSRRRPARSRARRPGCTRPARPPAGRSRSRRGSRRRPSPAARGHGRRRAGPQLPEPVGLDHRLERAVEREQRDEERLPASVQPYVFRPAYPSSWSTHAMTANCPSSSGSRSRGRLSTAPRAIRRKLASIASRASAGVSSGGHIRLGQVERHARILLTFARARSGPGLEQPPFARPAPTGSRSAGSVRAPGRTTPAPRPRGRGSARSSRGGRTSSASLRPEPERLLRVASASAQRPLRASAHASTSSPSIDGRSARAVRASASACGSRMPWSTSKSAVSRSVLTPFAASSRSMTPISAYCSRASAGCR